MKPRTWPASTLAVLIFLGIVLADAVSSRLVAQTDELKALGGEWVYFEDRTPGRELERLGPPMSSTFALGIEEGAVVLLFGHGGGRRDVRVMLDGSLTEVPDNATGQVARYRGAWKDGALTYEIDFVRAAGQPPEGLIRREFRLTPEGLQVRFNESIGLYRHAEDIPLPAAAKATIDQLAWLAGAWVGVRGTTGATSIEERWSPPLGGAMLAVSRTVSRGKLAAFEFLRIVERDGGLVYIAQPGGGRATEFVLTEVAGTRAVFENPRHDYPKRIVYELSAEGALTATIGFSVGGTPRRFEFKREAAPQ